jgi:pimeloyl-ACP methyl ester carboxylesterase
MASMFFNAFAPVRRTRDIVLIDQRGTGESNALRCEPASGRAIVPADSTRCLRALSRVANLRFYGTDDAVRDLDFVRATLGYERIDVLGFSYGTRVAWWYARKFPDRLRTIVMVSPNPPSQRLLQSAGEDFDRALHLIVADCLANADCANRFPRFEKELTAAIGALTPTQRVAMPLLLYSVETARRLPWMVNRAAAGDKRPLEAALSSALGAAQRQISLGLHLTVQCSEEFAVKEAVDRDPVGAALSDEYADACRDWPRIAPPRGFRDPFRSGARAFIIAGEWDPATPPRWADESARLFQDARISIVAKGTHGLSDVASCLGALVAQFLDERPMQTQCLHALASRRYFLGGSSN